MTLFALRITIYSRDGAHYTKHSTDRGFMWDLDDESSLIRDVIPGLPIPAAPFEDIIATCRDLDRHAPEAEAAAGVRATRPRGEQVGEAFREVEKTQAG